MKVTYAPIDAADPVRTKMAGLSFEANVPREVNESTHPEAARNARVNPWFKIEGEPDTAPQKNRGGRPANPKTAEDYRAWAIGWINRAEDARSLRERWEAEQKMREACGVGEDDLDFIELIMQPRLHHLDMADAA